MNKQTCDKLWVLKFCMKVVYPKYNYYAFLVYLAIKYRIWCQKRDRLGTTMDTFKVRGIPTYLLNLLTKDNVEEQLPVLVNKCIIISKEQYIQLCCENLFYMDNGVLWLGLKLTPEKREKQEQQKCHNDSTIIKYNLSFVTSVIHKRLWTDSCASSLNNVRVVPVVGSKVIASNVAFTSEIELNNILLCFGVSNVKDVEVSFHPVPALQFAPKIAAIAEVSLIANDFDLDNDFTKEVLNNYFEVPKLLSANDIFCIDLTPEITAKYHYKYLDLIESNGKLYFKCRKLSGDMEATAKLPLPSHNVIQPYFIVRGVTQLMLGENIHSLKPRDKYLNANDADTSLHLKSSCPTGLKHKFEQIQETIEPFVTGEINDLSACMSSPIIPMLLLTGSIGSGRHILVKIIAKHNGMNCLQIDCNVLQSSTAKQTESKISSMIQKSKAAAPSIVMLDNFEVFAVDPENNEDCRVMEYFLHSITDLYLNYTRHPIIFTAITDRPDLKPNILRMFLEKIHLPRLNVQQRYEMLQWFVTAMQLNIDGQNSVENSSLTDAVELSKSAKDVLQRVAAKTETFLYGDLDTLLHFAMRESYLKQHNSFNQLPPDADLKLVREEDFNSALESIRSLQSQHLDAPKIPKVYWEDIGGLEKLKKELLKTIEFPIKYPHLFKNSNLKRSGILLYGPPGCGKTLVAKAVSTELNVSFLSVKGPELLNMYIGQSEENVRKVFESARASSPCIVFLDELDALAPRRGAAGDSGGASDRVVSQLLAELDGVTAPEEAEASSVVFVMGATNRPDLLERSLLRPGRLDQRVYVAPYRGAREKTSVLHALCRNYKLRGEVDLSSVAEALPERVTGADLLQVVSTARASAVRSLVAKLNSGLIKEVELSPDSVVLGVSDMWHGVESFRPSVTDEELQYYESLQSHM